MTRSGKILPNNGMRLHLSAKPAMTIAHDMKPVVNSETHIHRGSQVFVHGSNPIVE